MSTHKALAIPELLSIILTNMPRRDRVNMALVCHYFWKVAIGLIWDVIPDVRQHTTRHPISRIVPKDLKYHRGYTCRVSPLVSPLIPSSLLARLIRSTDKLT